MRLIDWSNELAGERSLARDRGNRRPTDPRGPQHAGTELWFGFRALKSRKWFEEEFTGLESSLKRLYKSECGLR